MAELVDAYVSGAYVERRAGSSPVLGTKRVKFDIDVKEIQNRNMFVILISSKREAFHFRALRENLLPSGLRRAQVVKLVYTLL